MTVIDPADVDWTELDELHVLLGARSRLDPAVAEAIRRGLMVEGEEPPDPFAGWVEVGPGPVEGWVEYGPPGPSS